jgi:predicted branched-subunit amino acid permease
MLKPETKAKITTIKKEHHHHIVWTSTAMVAIGAVLFSIEMLAMAGIISVLGILLQGFGDDSDA